MYQFILCLQRRLEMNKRVRCERGNGWVGGDRQSLMTTIRYIFVYVNKKIVRLKVFDFFHSSSLAYECLIWAKNGNSSKFCQILMFAK